ncbi:MAG: hypothetical protein AABM64_10810 [Pseudomonadota bacterium]
MLIASNTAPSPYHATTPPCTIATPNSGLITSMPRAMRTCNRSASAVTMRVTHPKHRRPGGGLGSRSRCVLRTNSISAATLKRMEIQVMTAQTD